MCSIGATHAHTGKKYIWDEDDTIADMKSDDNITTIDIYKDNYEFETNQNHNYVDILESGLENAPDPSSTNE